MYRVLIVLALACITLLEPVKSYAQSDQLIVVDCTYPGKANRLTISLNLANKVVSTEQLDPNRGGSPDPIRSAYHGTVTQILDDAITFITGEGTINQRIQTLNRYAGNDTVKAPEWTVD